MTHNAIFFDVTPLSKWVLFMTTKVIISGPNGRMGQALCRLAQDVRCECELLGGLVAAGKEAGGAVAGCVWHSTLEAFEPVPGMLPVVIDFTQPEATLARLKEAADLGWPMVIGTTGFSEEQRAQIADAAKTIPVLLSANMSVGVNLLSNVIEQVARQLDDYDIEIVETHHRLKKDAPSGTALILANAAAAGREVALEDKAIYGRQGLTGVRPPGEIGIHTVRGGDVVGDHTVLFAGPGERLEFTHKASSRDTFAAGALFAARWLAEQPAGLYDMKDALGLRG